MSESMTPLARLLTALSHREPDRVPVFLFPTLHGAKALGLTLEDYFSRPEHVVEGQLRLRRKFGHDCLFGGTYGAVDYEAFGGRARFFADGPPNAGEPVARTREQITGLTPPDIARVPALQTGLRIIQRLKEAARGEVPVLGAVISPFSLPIMLLGFERYLNLIYEDRETFWRLMAVTGRFCVDWANAQFAAGATAVAYADPLSAVDLTDTPLFTETGLRIARETLAAFHGPAAFHLASGRALGRTDAFISTGAAALGVSCRDDLAALKRACAGRLSLMGNLNGIAMARWTEAEAEQAVRACLQAAAGGGGYVLADNHGEIPFATPEETIGAVMEAARTWGTYPIRPAPDAPDAPDAPVATHG